MEGTSHRTAELRRVEVECGGGNIRGIQVSRERRHDDKARGDETVGESET